METRRRPGRLSSSPGGETPDALMVYLPASGLLFRLYHQRTGYWQPDGQGIDPRNPEERAAALDLLAGGRRLRHSSMPLPRLPTRAS
jgi:hypothetical protein